MEVDTLELGLRLKVQAGILVQTQAIERSYPVDEQPSIARCIIQSSEQKRTTNRDIPTGVGNLLPRMPIV